MKTQWQKTDQYKQKVTLCVT